MPFLARYKWFSTVIPGIPEADIERIMIQSQTGKKVSETSTR
jgi:hypothetical protein